MSVHAWIAAGIVGGGALALLDEFLFAPEPGTELERRWSEALVLEVDSLEETIGGNPVDLPFSSIEFTERRSFELTDALERVAGGRPTTLTRGFFDSELGIELVFDGESIGGARGRHACDKCVVRFEWDGEEERYGAELVEGELDEERLGRLEPDLDLLGLLPARALEPGDTFTLEPAALRAFFRAGGDLGYTLEGIEARLGVVPPELMVAGALGSLHELFAPEAELDGRLEGRYAGREGEAEAEVARFEYELELEVAADLGERFRSFLTESAPDTHAFQLSGELEGELVLLWDVAARRPRSARFEGDVAMVGHLVFQVRLTADGETQEFVGDYELSGEAVVELASE